MVQEVALREASMIEKIAGECDPEEPEESEGPKHRARRMVERIERKREVSARMRSHVTCQG